MNDSNKENLPTPASSFPAWISDIPKAFIPSSLKAFDRLLGAVVDFPVALLRRETSKIEAQAKAFEIVEAAIAKSAGEAVGTDLETVERALKVLVRKEYRKQENREAVVEETIKELNFEKSSNASDLPPSEPLSEDWLNVFERFAEDASTERMQGLWGRVLAGEIRAPGAFSLRTLRFLSEFSQSDAVLFADICQGAVGQRILKALAMPEDKKDVRDLIQLEAAGLITGASGLGLTETITFDAAGHAFLGEGNLALVLRGEPSTSISMPVIALTPLGTEVMSLVPNRNCQSVMRKFGQTLRSPQIKAAFIGHQVSPPTINLIEQLWLDP